MTLIRSSRQAGLAMSFLVLCTVSSQPSAKLPADHAPTRNVSIWQGQPSLNLAVCGDPLVMLESEKTNVLKALLGEDLVPMQVAGR